MMTKKTLIGIIVTIAVFVLGVFLYSRLGGIGSDIVEVQFMESGGIAGIYYEVAMYEEDGEFYLSEVYTWQKKKTVYQITEEEFRKVIQGVQALELNKINGYNKKVMNNDGMKSSFTIRYRNKFEVHGQQEAVGYPSTHNAGRIPDIIEECISKNEQLQIPEITEKMIQETQIAVVTLGSSEEPITQSARLYKDDGSYYIQYRVNRSPHQPEGFDTLNIDIEIGGDVYYMLAGKITETYLSVPGEQVSVFKGGKESELPKSSLYMNMNTMAYGIPIKYVGDGNTQMQNLFQSILDTANPYEEVEEGK